MAEDGILPLTKPFVVKNQSPEDSESPEDGGESSWESGGEKEMTSRESPRSAKTRWGLVCTLIILALSGSANAYFGIGLATLRGFELDEERHCAKLGSGALPGYNVGSGKESGIEAVMYDGTLFPVCGDKNHTNTPAFDYT